MTRTLLAAIIAGVLAGLFVTAIQLAKVEPLILVAETYEDGGHEHASDAGHADAGDSTRTDHSAAAGSDRGHSHPSAVSWLHSQRLERHVLTTLSNILAGVAFAMLLTGAILLSGRKMSLTEGVLWGIAGFAVFSLAPSFGLAPNLPGMPSADLYERQTWWVLTVLATAAGGALLILQPRMALKAVGLALIVAPHVVGAPQPADFDTGVPAGIASAFAAATLVTSALFWVVLGGLLGSFLSPREST